MEKETCNCCSKKTERSEAEKKQLLNRLNRIEGQIRGLKRMVETDTYCGDILTQSSAVNAAISSFNKSLLGCHMHTCVVRDIKNGNEDVIDELADIIGKLMK